MKTQNQKLVSYFKSGRKLNQKQALGLFGVKNLRARVAELRNSGMAIYTNITKSGTNYRLGTPNQRMVRVAYRFAGTHLFE